MSESADPSSNDPAASPLDHIVDDYEPRQEALDFAIKAIASGVKFDDTQAKLIESGWSESDAQDIVEEARIQTQETRGVVTRDTVLRRINTRYSRGMNGGWLIGFPIWSSMVRLIHSLGSMSFLRRTQSQKPDERRE